MKSTLFGQVVKRWEEVTDLPPQTVGPFTPYYKMVTKRLKVMPWIFFAIGGVGIAITLYVLFGSSLSVIVTLLQRGF